MGFVKTPDELAANTKRTLEFRDAQMLIVFWETKPEIVAGLLPPPLKPAASPTVYSVLSHYPLTNFAPAYKESALFVTATHEGQKGDYCLGMHVTDDMALTVGREVYGFPKKIGQVHFGLEGNHFGGWAERRGVRYIQVQADLSQSITVADAQKLLASTDTTEGTLLGAAYNFKCFPAPDLAGFDYRPRLIRQETLFRPKEVRVGNAQIEFQRAPHDPWDQLEVVKLLGAVYILGDNSMRPGRVVAEVDSADFRPYAFLKWDLDTLQGR